MVRVSPSPQTALRLVVAPMMETKPGVDAAALPAHGREHTCGQPTTDGISRRLKANSLRRYALRALVFAPKNP